ncbi:MAG: DUF3293 domain-containing protein [Steroidobacteraceae bacterium]
MKIGPDRHAAIEPATLQAYLQTEYRVFGDMPATLQVGVRCAALAALHARYQTNCSTFVTACNPLGKRTVDVINAQQQQSLLAEISSLGLIAIPGIGQHPRGEWPGEPSYLVPGLERARAQVLGRAFQQNAIIWSSRDAVPQLMLLR